MRGNFNGYFLNQLGRNKKAEIEEPSMYKSIFSSFESSIKLKLALVKEHLLKLESDLKLKFLQNDIDVSESNFTLDGKSVMIEFEFMSYRDKRELLSLFKELEDFGYYTFSSFKIELKEEKNMSTGYTLELSFKLKI